jgi:hypothetical protein
MMNDLNDNLRKEPIQLRSNRRAYAPIPSSVGADCFTSTAFLLVNCECCLSNDPRRASGSISMRPEGECTHVIAATPTAVAHGSCRQLADLA